MQLFHEGTQRGCRFYARNGLCSVMQLSGRTGAPGYPMPYMAAAAYPPPYAPMQGYAPHQGYRPPPAAGLVLPCKAPSFFASCHVVPHWQTCFTIPGGRMKVNSRLVVRCAVRPAAALWRATSAGGR